MTDTFFQKMHQWISQKGLIEILIENGMSSSDYRNWHLSKTTKPISGSQIADTYQTRLNSAAMRGVTICGLKESMADIQANERSEICVSIVESRNCGEVSGTFIVFHNPEKSEVYGVFSGRD
jgi:hypothetical protein